MPKHVLSAIGLSAIGLSAVGGSARPVVLIDGRSGAGKSTLAASLAPILGAQLVSLDDVYPGWRGLNAGSAAVPDMLRDTNPGWQGGVWSDQPGAWHPLDPRLPLIIEGCGALSRENRAAATFGIWVELNTADRRRRALTREPDFAEHWDEWAEQERAFAAREHPRELADAVVASS